MIPIEQILVLLLTSKVCSRCKTRKGCGEFYADPRREHGLQSHCKKCFNESQRTRPKTEAQREANRRRGREWAAKERLMNPEKVKAKASARYRSLAPEKRKQMLLRGNELRRLKYVPRPRAKLPPEVRAERNRAISRAWAAKNRLANPEKARAAVNLWRRQNPENKRAYKARRMQEPEYKLLERYRTRVWWALKRNQKSATTRELLGCSESDLKAYLESLFVPGMTWENYGPVWHVDHRKPCDSFDFSDPAQQRECFHYTNLQPLFAEENLSKGAKVL